MRNDARHTHRFSYADYLSFEGDTRWELIDGEAHAMAPAPTTRHQRIVQNLAVLLFHCFRVQPCRPFIAPTDVKLSDFDVVQPDGLVVCDRAKIGEAAIVGTPELVIGVLSPATEARDRREKRALYEHFGIREFWIVSPNGFVEVYALDEQGRYPAPTLAGLDESFTSPRFPEFGVKLQDLFEGRSHRATGAPRPARRARLAHSLVRPWCTDWLSGNMPKQDYFRTVLAGQREWYSKSARKQKRRYLVFAICVIVLGALISLLQVLDTVPWVPHLSAALGAAVSISSDFSRDGQIRLYAVESGALRKLAQTAAPGGKRPFPARFAPDGCHIEMRFDDTTAAKV